MGHLGSGSASGPEGRSRSCRSPPGEFAIFVTGDHRDFGHLFGQVLEGVKVLTPADTLEAVT